MRIFATVMKIPIESMNFQLLNVGLAHLDGNWNWQGVSSPFTRIYLVTEGKAWLVLKDRSVPLRPGHLYIIPAHTMHSYRCEGRFSHYYMHFYEGFKNKMAVFDCYEFPTEVEGGQLEACIFASMCAHYPEAELPASDPSQYDNIGHFIDYVRRYNELPLARKLELRGSILLLFSRFVSCAKARMWTEDRRLAEVLGYIHSHVCRETTLDDLVAVACVTKSHLIRLFDRSIGVSPLQYINRKKIERAQLMLITEDTPIKEIAYRLGYNDYSYFIRSFRKMTGITPMRYRLSMR